MPDPIALADLRRFPEFVVPLVEGAALLPPERISTFPWPNGRSKLRRMAVIDPIDELVIRTACGEFVAVIDEYLPPKPIVAGYRLAKRPPGWTFQHPRRAHAVHRDRLVALAQNPDFQALVITDVTNCYGSMRSSGCAQRLVSIVGNQPSIPAIEGWWNTWEERDGFQGLPIGPEWSPTFAHALMCEVDLALVGRGFSHARWSDDIAVLVPRGVDPQLALDLVDERLALVGLRRSTEKTLVIEDPAVALKHVRNSALSGLSGMLANGDPAAVRRTHELFEEAIHVGDSPSFRFALRTMTNQKDPWAASRFVNDPSLMELDPSTTGAYLRVVSSVAPDVVAEVFGVLSTPPTERTAAVHLHLLKAATAARWGASEGRIFEKVHDDLANYGVIRWWASEAIAATPSFTLDRCVADVDAAPDTCAARRFALPVRRATDDALRKRCADRLVATRPKLRATAAFVDWRGDPIKK